MVSSSDKETYGSTLPVDELVAAEPVLDLFWCATIRLLVLLVGAAVARLPRPLVSHNHDLLRHSSLAASAVDLKMSSANSVVSKISRLGFPYETQDPFLFCVYHNDQVVCKAALLARAKCAAYLTCALNSPSTRQAMPRCRRRGRAMAPTSTGVSRTVCITATAFQGSLSILTADLKP